MKKKICIAVSTPMTVVAFLRCQLLIINKSYDLSVLANATSGIFLQELGINAQFKSIPIARKVRPVADIIALIKATIYFFLHPFDLVHSFTPKAGLISMLASWISRVPVRIHTFTGQVWATKSGISRLALKSLDKMTASFATHILVDSHSQRDFLIENNILSPLKASVLGSGSISGVNMQRFSPNPSFRSQFKSENNIRGDDTVFLYVGRLNRDKGIPELITAFEETSQIMTKTWLLVVGPDEESMDQFLENSVVRDRIIRIGFTTTPELFMAASDVFVLPSYREGFGSTIIEAAACGLPAIASRIYGLTDAVVDGQTGILFEPGSITELAAAMIRFAQDPEERCRMGEAARGRAAKEFNMQMMTDYIMQFYQDALADQNSAK